MALWIDGPRAFHPSTVMAVGQLHSETRDNPENTKLAELAEESTLLNVGSN